MKPSTPDLPLEGTITARQCECCGHHEIGIVTRSGEYFSLSPGMRVTITEAKDRPDEDTKT
ncbi:hypothetical protein DSCW_63260 [Desulfosarcina widdelii]|uniref:Uncharacterized protein n=1 Tax=Desulfosarcina widdelii TaxID=947919 RepID=A0A5K7ZFI3_9BACT|nr:hypothetical protein [Desulfosarcina widdelii]BBO78909.1 hypothetical protein DSCW_63260 [Desulfosarcina widdelii]